MLNEGKISDTMGKISDKIKGLFAKGKITIGDKAEKAAKFNRYDIAKIIRQILPTGKDRFDAKSKEEFIKYLDSKFYSFFGIGGMLFIGYTFIPEVKDFIDNNIGKDLSLWTFWLVSLVASYLNTFKTTLKTDLHDISITIEHDKRDIRNTDINKMVTVDFNFINATNVKTANNILYNAFIRKIEEYKGKEGIDIYYGKESMFQNDPKYDKLPQYSQHYVTMNFYPVELLDLIDEFGKELEESAKKNHKFATQEKVKIERRDGDDLAYYPVYYNMWIQNMTMKQVLDLAKRISKLEFSLKEIPVADYNEINKRRKEESEKRRNK